MQYKVILLDKDTNKTFEKYFKNEYFLRLFKNKANRSKKIQVLGVKDLFR